MTPEQYQRIGRLFDEALELPPSGRAAYLDQACGRDAELRAEVERLLANHDESGEYLNRPAIELAAKLLAQDPSPFMRDKRFGRYQILSPLGAGGMGEVYLAADTRLKRKVALKVLPATIAQDQDGLRRFEQEALAASALNHPNILTIYEFGTEGDTHFLASEFVDGETVRARLQRGPISLETALDIAIQTAQALAAAHGAGIIHRDIKPENVMIREDGIVKVLDFGLAKLVEPAPLDAEAESTRMAMTQAGMIMGTVAYMSPEQSRGKPVDARTDLFSLGVVLYEMLTHRHPFLGETTAHTMVAILEKAPLPLGQIMPKAPAELEPILNHALAKNSEERYASAQTMLAELKRVLRRLEVSAGIGQVTTRAYEPAAQVLGDSGIGGSGEWKTTQVRPSSAAPRRPARFWLLMLLMVLIPAGMTYWLWLRPARVSRSSPATAELPARHLMYSLTVQKYRDGKPYQAEFQASGREIFEPGWKFRLNLVSSQAGFIYLLGQEVGGTYVLLYPMPSQNGGIAHIEANERLQTGWYVFDERPGRELLRLVWSAQSVSELESFRKLVNPTDQGRIRDPGQVEVVNRFLHQHTAAEVDRSESQQNLETRVSGRGDVVIARLELEHH